MISRMKKAIICDVTFAIIISFAKGFFIDNEFFTQVARGDLQNQPWILRLVCIMYLCPALR